MSIVLVYRVDVIVTAIVTANGVTVFVGVVHAVAELIPNPSSIISTIGFIIIGVLAGFSPVLAMALTIILLLFGYGMVRRSALPLSRIYFLNSNAAHTITRL